MASTNDLGGGGGDRGFKRAISRSPSARAIRDNGDNTRNNGGYTDDPKLHRSKVSLQRLLLLFRSRPAAFKRALALMLVSILAIMHWRAGYCGGGSNMGGFYGDGGRGRRGLNGSKPRLFSFQPLDKFHRPRYRGGWINRVGRDGRRGVQQRPELLSKSREVDPMTEILSSQEREKKSKWYGRKMRYPIGKSEGRDSCVAQHAWQETSFPSCNDIHQVDMGRMRVKVDGRTTRNVELINNGGWSDIWMVKEFDGTKRVLKTKLYKHDFTDRNFDRYRRDALVMERLTPSHNVMSIFGFCGVTHLVEFSEGGDISNAMLPDDPKKQQLQRLRIAQQAARSLADLHNFDVEGRPSVSSTDITPYQFLLIDGKYKLNDFNRARFIAWDSKLDEPCPFYVAKNPGKWRAPEEYKYEGESEKIDVFSLGNIIYFILTGTKPWEDISGDQAIAAVKRGDTPPIDSHKRESKDRVNVALQKAIKMCLVQDPNERATAREVSDYLTSQLESLGVSYLANVPV